MKSKLNWLTAHSTPNAILLQSWLLKNGISYSLTQSYVNNGWLKRLSSGVFYRPSVDDATRPNWKDALFAVQEQLKLPVHLAGLSSLTYQGLNHYLQLNQTTVWLGANNKQSLPKWFREFSGQEWNISTNSKLEALSEKDFKKISVENKEILASIPELAAYEVIDAIGKAITFEHVAELFQGFVNFSPRKVQSLLERSRSVQANRIFLFLSSHYNHQWAKYLDETKIELGSGKRQVVKNGVYDERYQITIPAAFKRSYGQQI